MNTFQLNGYSVRFFQLGEATYLVAADANKAFGFDGKNTSIDEASITVADVPKYETFILDTSNGLETLPNRASVIELPDLLGVINRSNKSELKNMQGILNQLLAKAFAQNFGMQSDRKMISPMPSDKRMINSAISAKLQTTDQKKRRRRGEFAGWNTTKGLVCKLISEPSRRRAYLGNNKCMYGLRTALTAEYTATTGAKPPKVKSYNCKSQGLGYPPAYEALAKAYLLAWRDGGTSATGRSLLAQSSSQ
jgi:hypothetical protein